MRDMLEQIHAFNQKHGRVSGGGGNKLAGALMGGLLGIATGNVGAGLAMAAGSLMGGNAIGGQTPQMCSSEPFDPNSRLCL
jgi:predicted lipid-binding transport protein (Tim44 family)